jgi:hypothetical protein
MPNQVGMQQRNNYINQRSNYQGPNYQRHHSMGPANHMPQHMMPPPNQMMNQSMMSNVSSVASTTPPQLVDQEYARMYFEEIQLMFMSPEFKVAKKGEKKEMIGNVIYKHVEKLVGDSKAPKITGMLIDLPEAELNYSISQWVNFEQKVMSAHHLITQTNDHAKAPVGAVVNA